MTPPAPPPGFTGVRSRVLAHAQDGAHHVTLAIYTFDDPGHAPVEVPYVELHETHDGARPGRVMALSALVHLCQNASDDEVWAIGGRETPGAPGVDEAASLAREAVDGWAAAARCEGACQHGHECAPSAELVARLDALTGGAERATLPGMATLPTLERLGYAYYLRRRAPSDPTWDRLTAAQQAGEVSAVRWVCDTALGADGAGVIYAASPGDPPPTSPAP